MKNLSKSKLSIVNKCLRLPRNLLFLFISTFSSSFGGGLPILGIGANMEKIKKNGDFNSNDRAKSEKISTDKQTLLSLFEINIIRYSLSIQNIKPEHIDPFFMIDFMSLPESYFLEDAAEKYGI